MLRNAAWVLRQRRYAALTVFMIALAGFCAFAGTWQVSRYTQKVRDNDALRANAHDPTAPLTPGLLPLAGTAPAPDAEQVRYRTVSATGSYLPGGQQYLRNQSVGGTDGYLVITPLRTADGVLMVARGFVPAAADGTPPAAVPAAPGGTVRVVGRLQTGAATADHAGVLPLHMIDSVNPSEQAGRLRAPVYDGYLDLEHDQPGGAGLQPLPPPDLSNPAGGAAEWQHLAYIVQWYIFAGLALAAPFAVCTHEVREARRRFLGSDVDPDSLGPADGGTLPALPGSPAAAGALVPRAAGLPAQRGGIAPARWDRAVRLADRYGRSLGRDAPPASSAAAPKSPARPGRPAAIGHDYRPATSSATPARALDDYHGSYNDYLWQLALADGGIPVLDLPETPQTPRTPQAPDPDDGTPN